MSYKSSLLSKARLELLEAWVWYEDRQPGLGDRFKEEIFKGIHLIEKNPERYPLRKKNLITKSPSKYFPTWLSIELIRQKKQSVSFLFFTLRGIPAKSIGKKLLQIL